MIFNNSKIYDILKYFCLIGLPAIITFYGVLGVTLAIPYTEQVLTIATAFNVMLGSMLGVSSAKYNSNKDSNNE